MGWVVNATPWPLYPSEWAGTHWAGGWMGPRAGLDAGGKSHPDWDSIPGLSSPQQVAIPTELSHHYFTKSYVMPTNISRNSTFCPHSIFICFVWISEQTEIISLYSINWLVCITETECVYCAVRTGYLYTILRSAHTLYLCILCGSQNKQRLFPYTALTDWFL